jgi:hypothetical protein
LVFGKPITISDIKSGKSVDRDVRGFGEWRDKVPIEPYVDSDFEHGEFKLVGHGDVTNEKCGQFSGYYMGCDRVDLHNKITLEGVNYAGKDFVKKAIIHTCDKPSCPICFKKGWAVRQALSAEARLYEASLRFGMVEHIVASVPKADYGLSLEELREKVRKILKARGVVGGCIIFHGFRFDKKKLVWKYGLHFHVLGFVFGGYKCRGCKKNCIEYPECNGFEKRTREAYKKDKCIVKILGKRKTVGGTLWYQLNHSTYKKNSVRGHILTWFGCVSYRKMKVTVEMRKSVCPICQHDLVKLRYNGSLLDPYFLRYAKNFFVFHKETTHKILMPEVVWERVVSSGSHKYRGE